ncbi:arsenate reductase (glutaredoxin) [Pseudooceanicola spongiae]|uniref:Arsenate reductase n=1 Tax=Pseudooceanicola spongiae TaxID=2613965 RepID=A0A7L9WKE0_9RHOB|nr:arsenate reductase (glutaredoxin) [Pseudooceanicola spongiae]QOL79510.1 arsenate reductase (glutaredoxin) [Pseudooceanicola spongiae]
MITLWHNPRCSKSRAALALVEAAGQPFTTRLYLDDAPALEELTALQAKLDLPAIEMMRTGEALFRELALSKTDDDATLLAAMAAHPKLIERAVLITDTRAVIARPPERVHELL